VCFNTFVGRERRTVEKIEDARRERMLRELASDLADLVEAGEMTETAANEWHARKADEWRNGL
jgi:hypothetical protein